MKCDKCGKNEATFYYKSNINGRVAEQRLCADCARESGYAREMENSVGSWLQDDWFRRPFRMLEPFFGGFGSRMLTEFPSPLDALEQARSGVEQGASRQDDLLPEKERAAMDLERRRNSLRARLNRAVAEERFEDAAKLRDELKSLTA